MPKGAVTIKEYVDGRSPYKAATILTLNNTDYNLNKPFKEYKRLDIGQFSDVKKGYNNCFPGYSSYTVDSYFGYNKEKEQDILNERGIGIENTISNIIFTKIDNPQNNYSIMEIDNHPDVVIHHVNFLEFSWICSGIFLENSKFRIQIRYSSVLIRRSPSGN